MVTRQCHPQASDGTNSWFWYGTKNFFANPSNTWRTDPCCTDMGRIQSANVQDKGCYFSYFIFSLYRSAHWEGTLQKTAHFIGSACHNSNLKTPFLVDPKPKSIPCCWLHKINQSFYRPDSLPNGPLAICSPKGPVSDGVQKEWPDIYVMQRSMTSCLLLAKSSNTAES